MNCSSMLTHLGSGKVAVVEEPGRWTTQRRLLGCANEPPALNMSQVACNGRSLSGYFMMVLAVGHADTITSCPQWFGLG